MKLLAKALGVLAWIVFGGGLIVYVWTAPHQSLGGQIVLTGFLLGVNAIIALGLSYEY